MKNSGISRLTSLLPVAFLSDLAHAGTAAVQIPEPDVFAAAAAATVALALLRHRFRK